MKLYCNERVVAGEVIPANTFFKRFRGLMGLRELKSGSCMLIYPCNAIHTFFMRFHIDVIFLDRDYKVLKIIKGMKPWRISQIVKDARYVVEMQSGGETDVNIAVGDSLNIGV